MVHLEPEKGKITSKKSTVREKHVKHTTAATPKTSMAWKLVEDSRIIAAYMRGEVTSDELGKRGIKFAKPI